MADVDLTATTRTEFGKGASRRLRRAGATPAVLYGHGMDPVHLALPARETFLALRQPNVLLQITVEGEPKPFLALPKQIQRHAILHSIDHIDLVLVTAGEKVTVEVPLVFTGEAERGALVNHELNNLTVLAPATDIPNELEVSIEGLTIGSHLTVADITLPEGVIAGVEGDVVVVSVGQAPVADLGETDVAEGASEGVPAAE
ncbi:50S ribosomal protein L25/general stress protein Ctc [Tessaracoccus sp. Z1128]